MSHALFFSFFADKMEEKKDVITKAALTIKEA